jgi:predicted dehydrogenase
MPEARLVACCDVVEERARDFGHRFSVDPAHVHFDDPSFFADSSIEAVTVCAPSGMHAQMGVAALGSGRHVIVEKPMDISLAECDRLLGAASESNAKLGVISQHRFDPASLYVKKLLQGGRLGRLVLVQAEVKWYRAQEYYDSGGWRGTWALDGGGALMNQGVHSIDLIRWFGGPVERVWAVADVLGHERIEVEDVLCASMRFRSGALGTVTATTCAYPGFPATIHVHGTKGSVSICGDELQSVDCVDNDVAEDPIVVGAYHRDALTVAQSGTRGVQQTGARTEWGIAHKAQLTDFVNAVCENRAPAVDGIAGKEAVEVVLAIYQAALSGREFVL